MGFMNAIRNTLGIGGVSIDFTVPPQISKAGATVEGNIKLTSKSEQEVVKVEAILEEEFTNGFGSEKNTRTFELGKWSSFDMFTIKPGEVKNFDFNLNFRELKSHSDDVVDKGGFVGRMGKGLKALNNEKSRYFVKVNVDVKSAVLDPTERKEIKLV